MFIETCIAAVVLLGVAMSGLAQEKPDFSGGREVVATQHGARTVSSLRWEGHALVVAFRTQRADGEMAISFRYELLDAGRRLRADGAASRHRSRSGQHLDVRAR